VVETSESASLKAVTSSAKKRKLDESWIVSTDKNLEPVSAKPLTLTFKITSEPEEKEVEEEEEEIVGRKRTNKRTAVIIDSDSEDDDILPDR
jgi:hypothetical protein